MQKTHPYADAAYRVVEQPDETYGVEVTVADTYPTTVTSFASVADAEAWIVDHKRRVQESMARPRRPRWTKGG